MDPIALVPKSVLQKRTVAQPLFQILLGVKILSDTTVSPPSIDLGAENRGREARSIRHVARPNRTDAVLRTASRRGVDGAALLARAAALEPTTEEMRLVALRHRQLPGPPTAGQRRLAQAALCPGI